MKDETIAVAKRVVEEILQQARPISPEERISAGDFYAAENRTGIPFSLSEFSRTMVRVNDQSSQIVQPLTWSAIFPKIVETVGPKKAEELKLSLTHFRQPALQQIESAIDKHAPKISDEDRAKMIRRLETGWLAETRDFKP